MDITYLTPPLPTAVEPPGPWARFAHVTWEHIVPLLHDVWGGTDDTAVRAVVDGVLDTIATMGLRPSEWRAPYMAPPAEQAALPAALALAEQTGRDGTQRALEFPAVNLEELQQLRLEVRTAICASPDASPLRRVMPWLWSTASTGKPLTHAGAKSGYELRFSRYSKPIC